METSSNIILIGFSTAGKSFYSDKIEETHSSEFLFSDSDKFVSKNYGKHIFNIFMELGRSKAISYIEERENMFLQAILNDYSKPHLIAAGPFLVIREGWEDFIRKRNPLIIHLDKSAESIYEGLIQRKEKQKTKLDSSNPNFGSWDSGVTTEFKDGRYQDISSSKAINNIQGHLNRINPIYQRYRHLFFESDILKNNPQKQKEVIELMVSILRKNRS